MILRTSWAPWGNIKVPLDDRFASIGSKCAVGHFGWRIFLEEVGATTRWWYKSFLFTVSLALYYWRSSGRGTTAVIILVKVDVTATPGEPIVLLIAEMVVLRGATASPHAFKSVSVPALATTKWLIVAGQVAGRGAIHGVVMSMGRGQRGVSEEGPDGNGG